MPDPAGRVKPGSNPAMTASGTSKVIGYIDGFNLYFGLKAKGWRRYYWYDPQALVQTLIKPWQTLVGVKYFTARISASGRDPGKERRQAAWLEAIESIPGVTVSYGHYLRKPQQCFSCGAAWESHEEKMTDVNIAVEMLGDAFDDAFDTALLISADSDLTTPVTAVRARFPSKRVVVVSPPARQSKRLEFVASATFRLGRKVLHDSQLPDDYVKADGVVLKRPAHWS